MTTRDVIITIISAFGLVGCVSFMISYHRRSGGDWRRNEIGIWLMLSRLNLGLIFALLLSNRLFGDWTGRQEVIIALAGLFALQTFWPSKFLWRATRRESSRWAKRMPGIDEEVRRDTRT